MNTYETEFITAEMAKLTYGFNFSDLMAAADRGLVARSEMPGKNGYATYLFRRGDILKLQRDAINGN